MKTQHIIILAIVLAIIMYIIFKRKSKKTAVMEDKNVNDTQSITTDKLSDDYYTYIPSNKGFQTFTPPTQEIVANAFKKIAEEYGNEIAQTAERIYRMETSHFKSNIFKRTNSAGVVTTPNSKNFAHRDKVTVYVKPLRDDKGNLIKNLIVKKQFKNQSDVKPYTYVVFPTFYEGLKFLANYIKNKGIEKAPSLWSRNGYDLEKINKIKVKYT